MEVTVRLELTTYSLRKNRSAIKELRHREFGARGRIQTFNFRFVRAALYQLSYSGMVVKIGVEPMSQRLQRRANPTQLLDQMEPPERFELSTSILPRSHSGLAELRRRIGACDEDRTR